MKNLKLLKSLKNENSLKFLGGGISRMNQHANSITHATERQVRPVKERKSVIVPPPLKKTTLLTTLLKSAPPGGLAVVSVGVRGLLGLSGFFRSATPGRVSRQQPAVSERVSGPIRRRRGRTYGLGGSYSGFKVRSTTWQRFPNVLVDRTCIKHIMFAILWCIHTSAWRKLYHDHFH